MEYNPNSSDIYVPQDEKSKEERLNIRLEAVREFWPDFSKEFYNLYQNKFTPRQREIADHYVALDCNIDEIARVLGIKKSTVRAHMRKIGTIIQQSEEIIAEEVEKIEAVVTKKTKDALEESLLNVQDLSVSQDIPK